MFRIRLAVNMGLAITLCGGAAVIVYDVRDHRRLAWHLFVWATLIAILLAVFAIVARTTWGEKHWPKRLVVRPFETLRRNPDLNGLAVACLLNREMGIWLSERFKTVKGTEVSAPLPVLSLGWASLPLDVLFGWLKGVAGRRDVFIDGLVMDDKAEMKIFVWVSESARAWRRPLPTGRLTEVLTPLALEILTELEPKRVAEFYSYRWRDDDAIRLLTRKDDLSEKEKVTLAWIYLNAERLSAAHTLLNDLDSFLKDGDTRLDAKQCEAALHMKQGNFSEARGALAGILASRYCKAQRRCEAKQLIAQAFAEEYRLEEAIAGYDDALREIYYLCAKAGKINSEVEDEIREGIPEATQRMMGEAERKEMSDLLATAREALKSRARCRMLLSLAVPGMAAAYLKTASEDLLVAIDFDKFWTFVVPYDQAIEDPSAATLFSTLSQNRLAQGDSPGAIEAALQAINLYQQALPAFEDMVLRDDRDMCARASLAWCYFGRSAAWRMQSNLQESSASAANLDGLQRLGRVIQGLPAAQQQIVDTLYSNALLRQPGMQRSLRLWKTAEAIAASMTQERDAAVLEFASLLKPDEGSDSDDFGKAAIGYPPLLEAQKKADLDDCEIRALVNWLCRQLMDFVQRNNAQDQRELRRLWDGAEADVTAEQAAIQFRTLEQGDRRAKAEAAYGLACLSAILGKGPDAAKLLQQADELAGERTVAYRNRAVLDKDFDGVRLAPEFVQLTKWPPPSGGEEMAQRTSAGS